MSLVAVAQFAPGTDRAANLATIRSLVAAAAARGATLVVLPEYSSWFDPEPGPAWREAAEGSDGAFVTALAELAREHGVHLVAGMLQPASGPRVFNTVIAIDAAGGVVAGYRKLHLYDAFGYRESEWVEPGPIAEPETFAWEGFTVGIQTCYDVRFPEVTRRLVDAGADLVLVPAEWVRGPLKEEHWRTLVAARAIENTVYVAAADHTPPLGVGASMIVDPMGVALAALGEEAGVAVAEVALERVASVRRTNPALAARRFGVPEPVSPEHGVSGGRARALQ